MPLANDRAVGSRDLDDVALVERPRDAGDTGRQQRRAALDQRPPRSVVDADDAVDLAGEADPQLAGGQPPPVRLKGGADASSAGSGVDQHVGSVGVERSPLGRPDHDAICAAASFEAMPPLPRADPVPPAATVEQRVVGQRPR